MLAAWAFSAAAHPQGIPSPQAQAALMCLGRQAGLRSRAGLGWAAARGARLALTILGNAAAPDLARPVRNRTALAATSGKESSAPAGPAHRGLCWLCEVPVLACAHIPP